MNWKDLHNEELFTVNSTQFSRERFNALLSTVEAQPLKDYEYGDHLRIDTAEWFYKHNPSLKDNGSVATEVKANHKVLSGMANVSEMRQLKARTVSNRYGALVATKHLEDAVKKMPEDVQKQIKKQQRASKERQKAEERLKSLMAIADNHESEELEEEIKQVGEVLGATKEAEEEALEELESTLENAEDDVRATLRKACANASEELEEQEEMQKVFTGNRGNGGGGSVTPEDMAQVADMAKRYKELHDIATVAGRLQHIARATKQANAQRHTGEITDTTLGRRLNNLTGSEKTRLAHPVARKQVQARLLDNRAVSWKKSDRDKLGKGPMIVAVDNSGSMDGNRVKPLKRPIIWAKGVTLALYQVCAERKQPFHYLHWGGSEKELDGKTFTGKGGAQEQRELMQHSLTFFNGGNDLPSTWKYLEQLLEKPEWAKADVIIISDAIETINEEDYKGYLEALKKTGGSSYGIYLNDTDHYLDQMELYCDKVWLCRPSGEDKVLEELVHDLTKTT